MTSCRNCNTPLDGTYCPNCGQKTIDLERPLLELLKEIINETFDIDGRAFRTLSTLLSRPGVLTSEFLAGHRRRYTPPFRLYLVISVLFFFVAMQLADQGVLLEQGQDQQSYAPGQAQFLGEDLPRLMFLLLPIFAMLLKFAFIHRLYFDHLIFSVHVHSAAYVVLGFMLPLEQLASQHRTALVAQLLLMAYVLLYFAIAVRRVYRSGWLSTALKSTSILLVYMMVLSATIQASSSFLIIAD